MSRGNGDMSGYREGTTKEKDLDDLRENEFGEPIVLLSGSLSLK